VISCYQYIPQLNRHSGTITCSRDKLNTTNTSSVCVNFKRNSYIEVFHADEMNIPTFLGESKKELQPTLHQRKCD
jgi:hypothetical protein